MTKLPNGVTEAITTIACRWCRPKKLVQNLAVRELIANGRSVRSGMGWTRQELRRLKGMVKARMSLAAMADALERTPDEIRRKVKDLGL